MDFGRLLYAAHKNDKSVNKDIKCYKTKFEPPKKEVKSKTDLSANIKKFMQKREEEDRKKADEEKKKKEELLALRSQDKKAYKRVQTMLKRTKSANKSVMEDAIDEVNTVVTMAGPQQCDEDDYGYVSQEASAYYAKLMDKYSSMPPDEPKFPQAKKPVVKDLNAAKDRVMAALKKEEEEEMMPHKRKRKSKSEKGGEEFSEPVKDDHRSRSREHSPVEGPKLKKPKKMAPPPLDFSTLLKLAEQKQFEPVQIEKKVKEDENERPMTKKQRMEYEQERERRERRERRIEQEALKNGQRRPEVLNKIPKLSTGGEKKENVNGFGRIPKKSSSSEVKPRSENSNGSILKSTLIRKNSVDSDSTSRINSDSDRSKNVSFQRDRPRSSHQDNNRVSGNFETKCKSESSYKNNERRSSNPSQSITAAKKVKSRSHNMSDEERSDTSDSGYDRSGSRGNEQNHYKSDNEKHIKQSNHVLSDYHSGNDSRKYIPEKSHLTSSSYKQKPEVKYKPERERSKGSSGRLMEKSRDRSRSPRDRYRQSHSDSEPDDDKYRPSKVHHSTLEKKALYSNSPADWSQDRSRSPDTHKYNAKCKLSESDNGVKYIPSKKINVPSSKEKKLMSLFEGSDEESSSHDNHKSYKDMEVRKPKTSIDFERQKTIQSDSKFKIPKANSSVDKQKLIQRTEKYKPSENSRPSSSSNSKTYSSKEINKQSTNVNAENFRQLTEKNQSSIEKSKVKPQSLNESPKQSKPMEKEKKILPPQSAEDILKKSANVWSKPCNVTPSAKPSGSGLSASQIERLRQMNKKPMPVKASIQSPRDERTSDSRPRLQSFQGKSVLLKTAAAAAASRAASQRAQTNSDKSPEESVIRQTASDRIRDPIKDSRQKQLTATDLKPRQFPPNDLRPKQFPPSDLKPKQFPPSDLKPRPFPPKDVRSRQFPPADVKRKPKPRRIESESEEEYDSEMDDFIDDGSDMNMEQISKEIQSIFGYDRARFMGMEEDEECMESNFGQIDQEELHSLRIGMTEDLEDMKKERMEKIAKARRKMEIMKKKR